MTIGVGGELLAKLAGLSGSAVTETEVTEELDNEDNDSTPTSESIRRDDAYDDDPPMDRERCSVLGICADDTDDEVSCMHTLPPIYRRTIKA